MLELWKEDQLFRLEMIGALVIIVVGSLLHFCFEWSGEWRPAALFCAVNESVWEHMKIAFWPAFFFAVVEWVILKDRTQGFLFAKTMGFYVLTLLIPLLYYGYTSILGTHVLVIDILIFVVAAFVGQWVSYLLLRADLAPYWNWIAVIPLILIVAAFSLFTYFPPELEIFQNPQGGGYGIPM